MWNHWAVLKFRGLQHGTLGGTGCDTDEWQDKDLSHDRVGSEPICASCPVLNSFCCSYNNIIFVPLTLPQVTLDRLICASVFPCLWLYRPCSARVERIRSADFQEHSFTLTAISYHSQDHNEKLFELTWERNLERNQIKKIKTHHLVGDTEIANHCTIQLSKRLSNREWNLGMNCFRKQKSFGYLWRKIHSSKKWAAS